MRGIQSPPKLHLLRYLLVEFIYLVFTRMPVGVIVGDSGLCWCVPCLSSAIIYGCLMILHWRSSPHSVHEDIWNVSKGRCPKGSSTVPASSSFLIYWSAISGCSSANFSSRKSILSKLTWKPKTKFSQPFFTWVICKSSYTFITWVVRKK